MASPDNSDVQLPNPFTPLAFVPPNLASQVSFATYVAVGCLSILLWDILNNLHNDYLLLAKHKIKWPTVVYFVARFAALTGLIGKTLILTAELGNCKLTELITCVFFVTSHGSASLLLFLRVCAVYDWKRYIVVFFGSMWLLSTASGATVFVGFVTTNLGPTRYCMSEITHWYIVAIIFAECANDTAVFVAIMVRLSSASYSSLKRSPWRLNLRRTRVKRLTDAFREATQVYYLITVICNFATIIFFFVVDNPPTSAFRIVMVFPNTAIINIMACRVYRNLKLGYSGTGSDLVFSHASQSGGDINFHAGRIRGGTGVPPTPPSMATPHAVSFAEGGSAKMELEVKVSTFTEVHSEVVHPVGY